MPVEFVSTELPAEESDLVALERALGTRLPEPYRRFLAQYGGGRPRSNVSAAPKAMSVGVGVTEFFPVTELSRWRRHFSGRVPDRLLAIAADPCGNLVCLVIDGGDVGAVLFWDHELEAEEDELPADRNLTRISDDFGHFFDSLTPFDSSGIHQAATVVSAWINPDFLAGLRRSEPELWGPPPFQGPSSQD